MVKETTQPPIDVTLAQQVPADVTLHVYNCFDGADHVVAANHPEARQIIADHLGLEPIEIENDDVVQCSDEALLTIAVDDSGCVCSIDDATEDGILELTCREWADREGVGHLCREE